MDDLGMLVTAHAQAKPWLAASWAEVQGRREQRCFAPCAPELKAGIVALTSVDDDADGLTNTQEQWCTNLLNSDSDGDRGDESGEVSIFRGHDRRHS